VALARAAQRIEHEFVGVTCGLMDQAVVALGAPGAAFLFDCAQGCGRSLRLTDDAHAIVVFDTGKVRALAASGYNARFAETARAAAGISIAHERLALASRAAVESIAEPLHRRRARHVVSEQARVHAATQAIEARDWRGLGALLDASHASLRDDFEVSCPELDLAASLCRESSDCLGARMTGGGFGGCVVALWRRDPEPSALDAIRCRYRGRTGLELRAFVARSTGGVRSL
jgi:galactokinase